MLTCAWMMCLPTHHHCGPSSPVLIPNDQPMRFLGTKEVTGLYTDVSTPTTPLVNAEVSKERGDSDSVIKDTSFNKLPCFANPGN